MIALRPRDQHIRDPRPLPHETEADTKTNYCETETETETKKVVSRPPWSRDLNIPGNTAGTVITAARNTAVAIAKILTYNAIDTLCYVIACGRLRLSCLPNWFWVHTALHVNIT